MIRNLVVDPTEYEIDQTHFDFGLRMNYMADALNPEVNPNLHQYMRFRVSTLTYSLIKDKDGK